MIPPSGQITVIVLHVYWNFSHLQLLKNSFNYKIINKMQNVDDKSSKIPKYLLPQLANIFYSQLPQRAATESCHRELPQRASIPVTAVVLNFKF